MPQEVRFALAAQMRKPISDEEVAKWLKTNFPFTKISLKAIKAERKKQCPTYKYLVNQVEDKTLNDLETEEILEEEPEVQEQIRKLSDEPEFFDGETEKIDMLIAHRWTLKEYYTNYKLVKNTTEDQSKIKYLDSISKELAIITDLESAEKSFISALGEVKLAEQKMTPAQHFDSITGWFIPRMVEKTKTQQEALDLLFLLQMFLNDFSKIILESANLTDAQRRLLEKLYTSKKS